MFQLYLKIQKLVFRFARKSWDYQMTEKRVGFVSQMQCSNLVQSMQFELIFSLNREQISELLNVCLFVFCYIFYHSRSSWSSENAADYKKNRPKKGTVSFRYIRHNKMSVCV